jgi:ribosomal-protein-alanine N-acetyltransferase
MRLLNFSPKTVGPAPLEAERIILRRPEMGDFKAWAELRRESASFLKPYEPTWSHDEHSRSAFRMRLRRQDSDINSGRGLPWYVFLRDEPEILVGGLTISNIRRGVSDTGTLGYWMGEKYAGKGYMREALMVVCEHAFSQHSLHRLEAATVMDNERSQQLLVKCGFSQEGVARGYLKINGKWQDHFLFARLVEDAV